MYRYYFFENRRVDGRMKLFPLPGQTTYANHGSTAAPEVPVAVGTEVQMNILDRALVCSYHTCTRFGVRMEGSSRRQVRLMAYSDRGRTYYKASGLVPILFDSDGNIHTDEDLYNENRQGVHVHPDEAMITEYRAYIRNQNAGSGEAEAAPENETEAQTSDEIQGEVSPRVLTVVGRMAKVRSIGNHLADLGLDAQTRFERKHKISLLYDIMTVAGARFTYMKQNGDLRSAVGTLNEQIISAINPCALEDPRDGVDANGQEDGAHVVYFDIERQAWRSFCTEEIMSVKMYRLNCDACIRLANEANATA